MSSVRPALITEGVWRRITKLANTKGQHYAAVPYFGASAAELLPLKKGDQLVVRFDKGSIKTGQVDPREIVKLIKRGVDVHACSNLHAKVFAFGHAAIVGSANVSRNSASSLIEACAEVNSASFALKCRRFVKSLCGDHIHLEHAQSMVKYYRPPAITGRLTKNRKRVAVPLPAHSGLWFVSLEIKEWSEADIQEANQGRDTAKSRIDDINKSRIEEFVWYGSDLVYGVTRGERVLMSTSLNNSKVLVSPPGRVLDVRRYREKGRKRAIIYVEVPINKRRRALQVLKRRLGSQKSKLGNIHSTRRIRDPRLVYAIDQAFL
jgi:hypothetical protein